MAELGPGVTLSHYHIVAKIGAGGMGEVYLAQEHEARSESGAEDFTC